MLEFQRSLLNKILNKSDFDIFPFLALEKYSD